MRIEGKLKSWDDERGFGFIEPTQGGQDIFVHIHAFPPGKDRPLAGQRLSFEVELGPQGKKRAKRVEWVKPARMPATQGRDLSAQWGTATLFAIPAFLLVYWLISLAWGGPRLLHWIYLIASAVTFLAYAQDKSAARRQARRVPERTLHMLSMLGGWPGALIAQQYVRHKSSKEAFRKTF
jgi:uncharacterized membrane protein YsdA (DUF1294 family)/cold shock CspA family protein